jgi:ABC-type multidrug transport system fused ATPase/permease subunit
MTPTSRIIARATADIRKIDDTVSFRLWRLTEVSTMMLVSLGSILLFAPAFLVPGIVITILGGCLGQVYLAAQLPMRRLISINQAPILGVFSAAVVGLVSIRAYGAEDAFLTESRARIDAWVRPALPSAPLSRNPCLK